MQPATLVLLPGLDGTGTLFAPLLRALPASLSIKVIAYPPAAAMGYDDLCNYAASQLPDCPIVILGESFSGPIAALLAKQLPQRVKGLVLASSFVSTPRPRFLSSLLAIPGVVHLSKTFARFALLGMHRDAEMTLLMKQVIPDLPTNLVRFRALEVLNSERSEQFAKTACPVLILHGVQDLLVPKNYVKKLVRLRPDAKVCIIQGPHMLLQIKPTECAAEIAKFAAACTPDAT